MHTETYRRLASESGKWSDAHMDCMGRWLKGGRDPEVIASCREGALKYKRALEAELRYLRSIPATEAAIRRIGYTEDYLRMVKADLARLTDH